MPNGGDGIEYSVVSECKVVKLTKITLVADADISPYCRERITVNHGEAADSANND